MRILRVLLLVVCAAAATQSALAQDQSTLAALRAACADDVQRLCAGVQPGGGRIVACLKQHKDSLSDQCKQAAAKAASQGSSSAPSPASSTAPSSDSDAGRSVPAAAAPVNPAPAPKGTPLVILGERFVQRAVVDTQQGGMTAVTIHVPESWHFESKIEWNYDWVAYPVNPSWHAENPANAEAYFQYESWQLVDMYVAPRWRQYVKQPKPGERVLGQIYMAPVPPLQAMAAFIKSVRGDVTNLKWLGQQDLPDLAKDPAPPPFAQPARRRHKNRLRLKRQTRRGGLLWRLLHE